MFVHAEAFGITRTPEKPDAGANLRDTLTAFLNALRTYVVRVSANMDDDDKESVELATLLLEPVTRWETSKSSGGQQDKTEPAPPNLEGGADKGEA